MNPADQTLEFKDQFERIIIIPGGGLNSDGNLPQHVIARLDKALELANGRALYMTLSAGTNRHPNPRRENNFPDTEANAGARYLLERGIAEQSILVEPFSYDTIGNAYFARVVHCDLIGIQQLTIVNSEFHMPRTKLIFDHVFKLKPEHTDYKIDYVETPNVGLIDSVLDTRHQLELTSYKKYEEAWAGIKNLQTFQRRLFTEHGMYNASAKGFCNLEKQEWSPDYGAKIEQG